MLPDARRVLKRLTVQRPADPAALHLYSVALYESGERDQGIEVCRRVLKIDPRFVPAMHNVAVACVLDHQWSKARYWVHQALLVDPDDSALRHLRLKLRLHTLMEAVVWGLTPVRWAMTTQSSPMPTPRTEGVPTRRVTSEIVQSAGSLVPSSWVVTVVAIALAAAYTATPWSRWARARCRAMCGRASRGGRLRDAVSEGLAYTACCAACSVGVMGAVVVLGMSNLVVVVAAAAVMLAVKLAR